jgi:tRNA-dihydrouridine synthase
VNIPVIGNGDIKSLDDALKMVDYTGVDAFMIGRGALGNPWLIKEISCYYQGIPYIPPTNAEKVQTMIKHLEDLITLKGEKLAVLEMRSLADWYVKGFINAREFKQKLVYINTYEEFIKIVRENLQF